MASLISVPGKCGAECANKAIIANSQMKRSYIIKVTSDLYEIVLIIFVEISAVTLTHPPLKLLQQILSTKKFNDSGVMLTMLVSRLWILSRSTSNPASSLAAKILKD